MLLTDGQNWRIDHGDSIQLMHGMPAKSVDFSVFSPPFPTVYAYSDSQRDIGNSENFKGDAKLHLSFFFHQFARVLKPGRVVVVHCQQVPKLKRTGEEGMHDFRGLLIRLGERAGLKFEYDWAVRKNPQAQAIRTRSHELQFAGLESDRARSRGALPDHLLKFRAKGVNQTPILSEGEVSRNDWIRWAEHCWDDVIETDTLNVAEGRGEDDTRHVCPLQLEVIRRLVILFSNPGEIVFSPFSGIGSEGYMATGGRSPKTGKSIKNPRRFYGIELKPEYMEAARKNMERVENQLKQEEAAMLPGF